MTIDHVIETLLLAIYSNKMLADKLILKGGQALRVKEKLINRFSADADFSTPQNIENTEIFFELLHTALSKEFHDQGYYVFSFKFTKRPKTLKTGAPDYWSGWGIEFKIIEANKRNLSKEKLDREALIPDGAISPRITLDVSEYEYCGSIEKIKIGHSDVVATSYSRTLLILEKIRAICQQHPKYPHKNSDQRARDYYDIERLWEKSLQQDDETFFIEELQAHVRSVFAAKDVNTNLLVAIFEADFIEIQRSGWAQVVDTVKGRLQNFDYYVETLRRIVAYLPKE